MDCYMKNEAKWIVKTANLLCKFLVSLSLAPEQYIYIYIYICVCVCVCVFVFFALLIRRANRTRLETLCFNR